MFIDFDKNIKPNHVHVVKFWQKKKKKKIDSSQFLSISEKMSRYFVKFWQKIRPKIFFENLPYLII